MFEINENYEIHPDRSSYEEIWGKIIKPEINKYVSTYTGYTKMNSDHLRWCFIRLHDM